MVVIDVIWSVHISNRRSERVHNFPLRYRHCESEVVQNLVMRRCILVLWNGLGV